jgi:hypothetical protein
LHRNNPARPAANNLPQQGVCSRLGNTSDRLTSACQSRPTSKKIGIRSPVASIVGARPTRNSIPAAKTENQVVAVAAIDCVVPGTRANVVVPAIPLYGVISRRANDGVGA